MIYRSLFKNTVPENFRNTQYHSDDICNKKIQNITSRISDYMPE